MEGNNNEGMRPWAFPFGRWRQNSVLTIRQAKNGFIVKDNDGERVFVNWSDVLIYMQKVKVPTLDEASEPEVD